VSNRPKERLTALVLLAVEDEGVSPMIFYRTDCADMALDESDVDEAFVKSSANRVSGIRHAFFAPEYRSRAAQGDPKIAKANGGKVVFDIDYRPEPLGPCRPRRGLRALCEIRPRFHRASRPILPDCDLIVGTEEESA
jgi:5-dehydro-2-deoxygluconokinase